MTPGLPLNDTVNQCRIDTVDGGYFPKTVSPERISGAYIYHLFFGEFSAGRFGAGASSAFMSKDSARMNNILRVSNDFEIGKSIIGSDAINMIDFHTFRDGTDEGLGDQSMDPNASSYPITTQAKYWISRLIDELLNQFAFGALTGLYTANFTQIANLIDAFIFNNCAPFTHARNYMRRLST